jgi:hypothetical protein
VERSDGQKQRREEGGLYRRRRLGRGSRAPCASGDGRAGQLCHRTLRWDAPAALDRGNGRLIGGPSSCTVFCFFQMIFKFI